MVQVKAFTFNPFAENTYVLYDETFECVIVDAGCYDDSEKTQMVEFIDSMGLKPKELVNTHCHIDHVLGLQFLANKYNLGLRFHQKDMPVFDSTQMVAQMYGIPNVELPPSPAGFFEEGETIEFGNSKLEILFTPGHSPGHVVFVEKQQKMIIGGDVLFHGSIGRTDLPGGDHQTLINSIKTKLLVLDDDFQVFSGHGPVTNIGFERKSNPFLQ